ncbi:MAG TPA: hypothetical protein VKE74_07515 [Gemmataceae bacterium]|nr:hypothetical protein [Gemmataceae bacterium]
MPRPYTSVRVSMWGLFSSASGQAGVGKDSVLVNVVVGLNLTGNFLNAIPPSAAWGATIDVQTQVKNTGLVASGPFREEWYLSRDAYGSADDIRLNLASGATGYDHPSIGPGLNGPVFPTQLVLPAARPTGWVDGPPCTWS